MDQNYPSWIDEYAKMSHRAWTNMVPTSFGPIDLFALFSVIDGKLLERIYEATTIIKQKGYKSSEIAESFSTLSSLRWAFIWSIYEYQRATAKDREKFKNHCEFFLSLLTSWAKEDIFAYQANIAHTESEISGLIRETKLQKGNPLIARELGKLNNSLVSWGIVLYRDFFHQESNEVYGPYDVSGQFGPNTILTIKDFANMKPVDLWPETQDLKYEKAQILSVYKDVKFTCEAVGIHSLYEGDVIDNLVNYAVIVDGKYLSQDDIKNVSDYFAQKTFEQAVRNEEVSTEAWKVKTLEWLCYQYNRFFELANMDWRPTSAILETIKNKNISTRYERETFPTYEEYINSMEHEVYWLKDAYQS